MKHAIFLLLGIVLASSCQKKGEVITAQNVNEVLTAYGKENTEDEVEIETSFGKIRLKLYSDTPLHRANFIKNIKEGYYDDSDFYRIVSEFMIQGGDQKKYLPYRIPPEFNPAHFHRKGVLAAARTDNPEKESSSTEFYIVQGRRYADWEIDEEARNLGMTLTPEQRQAYLTVGGDMSLDNQYTVFGEVLEGLDVVDAIAKAKVYNERPNKKIPLTIHIVGK